MQNLMQIGLPAGWEWFIVLAVVVIVLLFGSRKIPELSKSIGRAAGEFRKGRQEVEKEIKDTEKELKDTEKDDKDKEKDDKEKLTERQKLEKVAKDLGISTNEKSDEDLKKEIKEKME
jgi:sec-independent protein translocase protein TatA